MILSNEEGQRLALEAKLKDEQEKEKDVLAHEALELQQGGVVALQEAILKEVEKKHSIEIKVLIPSQPSITNKAISSIGPRSRDTGRV